MPLCVALLIVSLPPTRLEAAGVVARFVIGHSADADAEAALADEEARHADLLRLPLTEGYAGLPAKTIMFLRVRRCPGGGVGGLQACMLPLACLHRRRHLP